jgi:hypothetical protein
LPPKIVTAYSLISSLVPLILQVALTSDSRRLPKDYLQKFSMTLDSRKRAIFYVHRDSKLGKPHEYVYFRIAPARG